MTATLHGKYKIYWQDHLLVVECHGAWSKETAVAFCEAIKHEVTGLQGKAWGCLVDVRHWQLGVPEIWQPIAEQDQWLDSHGHQFEAVVCNLKIQEELIRKSHRNQPHVQSAFFENIDEAKTWLQEKLTLSV